MENEVDKKNQWEASDLNKNKNDENQEWEMIEHDENKMLGEEKFLLKLIETKNRFKVIWRWQNCTSNEKKMHSLKKAQRLYSVIDLEGWGEIEGWSKKAA